jgi:F-type H+-transporting ATPase subunit b
MLIDWFTVFAQIANFLILVAILKRFLYGRIIDTMEKREALIAERIEQARREREEAEKANEAYSAKIMELEEMRESLIGEMVSEVEASRLEMMEKARKEAAEMKARWEKALKQETESLLGELRRFAVREAMAIARRALKDLAGAEIEGLIISRFITQIKEQGGALREMAQASGEEPATVTSSFAIPEGMRREVLEALRGVLPPEAVVRFNTSEEAIGGIELRLGGFKVSWSIDAYLGELEERVAKVIEGEETSDETLQSAEKNA